ncbi:MA3 domain protein [Necator americanus]|uniref:MA3 domain protein n=1 Tax=Necator americanus TaxID=51031 RepID=W2TRY8_NECAM|nr:MA3 domain protein [Necator americanus]ETN84593.1 MA3 domain protein [Necator americanus]
MWVVGSAYRVVHEAGSSTSGAHQTTAHSFPEEIVQLARRAKMNTEIRRNVFCTIATSNDDDSAFERLLRLSLKGQQEREIIYVLIMMSLREKAFNPFYPTLIARFCEFDKRFVLTTQYALWDRIRGTDALKLRARCRLADLIHHLISHETLSITVLKVCEFFRYMGETIGVGNMEQSILSRFDSF